MGQLNIRIPDALIRRFETTAAARGQTNSKAAAEALVEWVGQHVAAVVAVASGEPASEIADDVVNAEVKP